MIYYKLFVNYSSILVFILCCFIPINESYYNHNYHDIYDNSFRSNNQNFEESTLLSNQKERETKSSRTMWKENSPIMTFPPYSRSKYTSRMLPQDLVSQETMDVSKSIWGNDELKKDFTKYNSIDWNNNPKDYSNGDFAQSVNGLVDEWIYNDYDEYENYPNEDTVYQDKNENPNSYWTASPSHLAKDSHRISSSPYQDYSMTNANRRADNANKNIEIQHNHQASKYQSHPIHLENIQKGTKYRNRKGDLDENVTANQGKKNVEGKQIISGIDINPLTSNAFMGFSNPSFPSSNEALKDLYNTNDIFSDLKFQSNRMKKGFDKALQGVGDATIGKNNKEEFKNNVDHFVSSFTNTMNEIDDNSINSKIRNKLKFGGKNQDSVMSSLVKKERYENRKVENKKKKFPQIIQRVKNNIKGMGNFVIKKTKQMLTENPKISKSNIQLAPKDQKLERQGGIIGSFGSLLSGVVGGPAMTWVSVVSLVMVEVVAMGLQSAFQISQSTPTSAPPKPTETTTKGKEIL